MTEALITEEYIDTLYDAVETISIAKIVLSNGDVTDKTAGSISWLLGSIQNRLTGTIMLVETLQKQQAKGGKS